LRSIRTCKRLACYPLHTHMCSVPPSTLPSIHRLYLGGKQHCDSQRSVEIYFGMRWLWRILFRWDMFQQLAKQHLLTDVAHRTIFGAARRWVISQRSWQQLKKTTLQNNYHWWCASDRRPVILHTRIGCRASSGRPPGAIIGTVHQHRSTGTRVNAWRYTAPQRELGPFNGICDHRKRFIVIFRAHQWENLGEVACSSTLLNSCAVRVFGEHVHLCRLFVYDASTAILPGSGCLYRQSSFSGIQRDLRCSSVRIGVLAGVGVSARSRKHVSIHIFLYHNGKAFQCMAGRALIPLFECYSS